MKFRYLSILTTTILLCSACMKGESVDLIIHNAKIYTMDDANTIEDAIAIRDGKIIEVGPEREILNRYRADEFIDAQLKEVYPGFTDAHGHIMSYARQMLSVNLVGSRSYNELLVRLEKYQSRNQQDFIIGRGWDQSRWKNDEMPTNEKLNELFPNIPVCLFRIDGHALLANDYLIKKSDVLNKVANDSELSSGGYFIYDSLENFTGIMVDNAMNPILDILPDFTNKELSDAIIEIQEELYAYGVTGVHEAGLKYKEVKLFQQLIEEDVLNLNIYGMLLPTKKNIEFAHKHGVYQNNNLLIRSFKVYGDGALGSRGAFLKAKYSDKHDHQGYLTTSVKRMKEIAEICNETGYQMNTHAIGDSTNRIMLELYQNIYKTTPDHRWRIEHAQIIDPADFALFAKAGVFPSVQPTHAVSDQHWAESRLGRNRMEGSYAYNSLLSQFGMLAIGTDFPVELTDPFLTIHAAVNRTNSENIPASGFQPEEAITLNQCIRGMTTWAAYASFQENELGTIEVGKDATIVLFESPVNASKTYNPNFAYMTFINGKKVYSVE